MKYDDITYETILERMIERVGDNYDKRESSIISYALRPAAVELALLYMEFDIILKETFGDTASRDNLILRAAERNVTPFPPTYSIVRGEFIPTELDIPMGSRFSIDELTFETFEKISPGQYKLKCEQLGSKGNNVSGTMIPIDYIEGLETVNLTELLIPGEDEEGTESIRERYSQTFDINSYGGNQEDYKQKTNAITGVGGTKVTPIWNGGGTVKLTILNSDYDKASTVLVEEVQKEIDPTQRGDGLGIAPIDHIVTVDTVNEIPVTISLTLTLDDTYTFENLKPTIETLIKEYLLEVRSKWSNQPYSIVRIAQIDTRILKLDGVIDITNTRINGVNGNLELTEYDIPVLGGVVND